MAKILDMVINDWSVELREISETVSISNEQLQNILAPLDMKELSEDGCRECSQRKVFLKNFCDFSSSWNTASISCNG